MDDRHHDQRSPDDYEEETMAGEEDEDFGDEGAIEENDFLYHNQHRMHGEEHGESSMLIDLAEAQAPFKSSAQEILRPLQDTADRVTRQVEEFAQALDKFTSIRKTTEHIHWENALVLLERYSQIADNRKNRIPAREGDDEGNNLQLESDLWVLVRDLLYANSPGNLNEVQLAQESNLSGLHRYSNNTEIWTAFLDSDTVAQEYESTLSWLHRRAESTSPPIEETTHNLINKASRGNGVWSSGPMFTAQKIKAQKRTRVWSMPLEPSNPGLKRTHIRRSDETPLVTQLDPDACTRESAVLEDEDEYYDQAAWQTYWEMLRRGQSNTEIQAWFAERKMVWRYTALCGCGTLSKQMEDSPWVRILNLATNSEWLARCRFLNQDAAIEDRFQRAVYGVLSGDVAASKSVVSNIEDYLFCIFNSFLMQRYQQYLQAFKTRPSQSVIPPYRPHSAPTDQIQQYLAFARADPQLKEEIYLPHKLMELAVLSKDLDHFLVTMGRAAAHVAYATGQGSQLMKAYEGEVDELASLHIQDQDCVRMVVHLQLLLKSLGLLESLYVDHEYELENIIATYIGQLEIMGRWLVIPLYASKLSAVRSYHVLGAILINVTDQHERDLQMKLLKQNKINLSEVAYGIFSINNYSDLQKLRKYQHGPISGKITMMGGAGKIAQHKVRPGLMEGELNEAEEKAIRSVEWFRYVDAENWGLGSWSVAVLYKLFLLEGNFVALRHLLERVRLSEISLAAVGMNLHFTDIDIAGGDLGTDNDEMDEDRVHPLSSPNRKRKADGGGRHHPSAGPKRQSLALSSLVWKQLEQLVTAIRSLSTFQKAADNFEQ